MTTRFSGTKICSTPQHHSKSPVSTGCRPYKTIGNPSIYPKLVDNSDHQVCYSFVANHFNDVRLMQSRSCTSDRMHLGRRTPAHCRGRCLRRPPPPPHPMRRRHRGLPGRLRGWHFAFADPAKRPPLQRPPCRHPPPTHLQRQTVMALAP